MTDNTAMVVSTSDFATWIQQQTALDAPIMKYPAAVQPHVRTVANDLRVVTMFDTFKHTRES